MKLNGPPPKNTEQVAANRSFIYPGLTCTASTIVIKEVSRCSNWLCDMRSERLQRHLAVTCGVSKCYRVKNYASYGIIVRYEVVEKHTFQLKEFSLKMSRLPQTQKTTERKQKREENGG